ncbi:autotransporter outer membrane beta-barrel domain-containing protein [Rhodomicrobium lacus]|uniref:autotransporter outer membrane beta-barrel domain-containing protein n=1 Tax=Rhodomicrobium lacus TaxID=2498452 RepID=UPI0026E247E0|nr:autotransporter domain-containing protein [Rhodomicrobium lacus]WKW50520.1 autotransporter domain-containing protein [Rhodomicrobium lacus]
MGKIMFSGSCAAFAAVSLVLVSNAAEAACGSGGSINTASGCQTLSTAGSSLTVTSLGSVAVTSGDAVTASGSNVTITNSGTISDTANGKRAIKGSDASGSLTITNNAGATITASGDDAIKVGSNVSALTITNAGTISATGSSGQAIDARDATGGTITNSGILSAAYDDALRPGSNMTITNTGTIISTSPYNTKCPDYLGATACASAKSASDAIDVGGNTGVTVNNYGTISGPRHGITADTDVTVYNYAGGTITGNNGSGVGSDGKGRVYNWGTITGAYAGAGNAYDQTGTGATVNNGDGDGVDIDGVAYIENWGIIQGTGAGGVDSGGNPNGSEGIAAGGGTLINHTGATISGATNGILIDDGSGGAGVAAVSITNDGTITGTTGYGIWIAGSTYDNTITNSGTITGGTAAIRIDGGNNTVTLLAGSTINGAIQLGNGNDTLNLYTGATVNGQIDGGTGEDTLNLKGTGAGSLSNATNFESLNIYGGAWTLTSGLSFSGNVTVASTAVLKVGDGIGTLTVGGNFTQASGSTYAVQVTPGSTASDAINITGAASVDGAILNVSKTASGRYTIGSTYTVLTAAGGVSGEYTLTGDTTLSAFYDLVAKYPGNAVTLAVTQTSAFSAAATTRNETAAANGLQSLSEGNTLRDAVGYLTSYETARVAFNQLSGEAHASAKAALVDDSRFARSAALDRLRDDDRCSTEWQPVSAKDEPAAPCAAGLSAWGRGFGSWGGIDGNGNAHAIDHTTGGFFAGFDGLVGSGIRAGFLSGYSHSTYKASEVASSGSSENYHFGLYGGGAWGPVALRVGGSFTISDISLSRGVAFTGYTDRLKADYQAVTGQVFGEVGYSLGAVATPAGAIVVEPFAGLAFVNVHSDAFNESGGAAALAARSGDTGVGYSTLGVHLSRDFALGGSGLTAKGSFGWRHAFGDVTPTSTFAFSGGDAFTVAGSPISRDVAFVEAGLGTAVSSNVTVGVSYVGQFGDRSDDNGVRGTVVWKF